MEQWWNDTDRGKLKYWEKNLSQCPFGTTNPRPVTDHLSYRTDPTSSCVNFLFAGSHCGPHSEHPASRQRVKLLERRVHVAVVSGSNSNPHSQYSHSYQVPTVNPRATRLKTYTWDTATEKRSNFKH
jgi:hypothetical protein